MSLFLVTYLCLVSLVFRFLPVSDKLPYSQCCISSLTYMQLFFPNISSDDKGLFDITTLLPKVFLQ